MFKKKIQLNDIDLLVGCFIFGVLSVILLEYRIGFFWYFGMMFGFFLLLFCLS